MQNIDYSRRIRRTTAVEIPVMEHFAEQSVPKGDGELKRKNRFLVVMASTGMVMFTLGIMAGMQLNKVHNIEENLIRYPDEKHPEFRAASENLTYTNNSTASGNNSFEPENPVDTDSNGLERGESVSFANRGVDNPPIEQPEHGSFIIKVGIFDPDQAEKISAGLNNIPGIAQATPYACRKISESIPDRYMAFRTNDRSSPGKQSVMIGCFLDVDSAREILDIVLKSGLSGTASSRVYQID